MKNLLFLLIGIAFFPVVHATQDIHPAVQQGHFGSVSAIALSPDNKTIASLGDDGQLILWDLNSGMQLKRKMLYGIAAPLQLNYVAKDNILIKSPDRNLSLNPFTNLLTQESKAKEFLLPVKQFCLSGDYKTVLNGPEISFFEREIRIAKRTSRYFNEGFTACIGHADLPYVFAASKDGLIYVYHVKTGKPVKRLNAHRSSVNDVCISSDGKYLYSASTDRTIIEWDTKTLQMLRRFNGFSYRITSVCFTENNTRLAFGDEIGNIKLFDLNNYSQQFRTLKVSNHAVLGLFPDVKNNLIFFTPENRIQSLQPWNSKIKTISRYHRFNWKITQQGIFERGLGMYLDPRFDDFLLSTNDSLDIFLFAGNEVRNRNRRKVVVKREGKSRKNIRHTVDYFKALEVLNDSTYCVLRNVEKVQFMSEADQTALDIYLFRKNKLYRKTIPNSANYKDLVKWNEQELLLSDGFGSLTVINVYTNIKRNLKQVSAAALPHTFQRKKGHIGIHQNGILHIVIPDKNGNGKWYGPFTGHDATVNDFDVSPAQNLVVTASDDATVKFWELSSGKLKSTLIPTGNSNFILLDTLGNYQITKNAYKKFGYAKGTDFIFPDQFDLKNNKPHAVLKATGIGDSALVHMLEKAYSKRLKRMGFREEMLSESVTLPEIRIISFLQKEHAVDLEIACSDTKMHLDRINLYVNDVPVLGSNGFTLQSLKTSDWKGSFTLPLLPGKNKIEVSVLNESGIESVRNPIILNNALAAKPDLFIISIGVGTYHDARFNLNYPTKDAEDLVKLFESTEGKLFGKIHSKVLINKPCDASQIKELSDFLKSGKPSDQLILFYAGHGVLDKDLNYFLGTPDIDFNQPSTNGLAYEDFERIIDGVPQLRKLVLIDACHSGEIDKDEVELLSQQFAVNEDIKFRNAGAGIQRKNLGFKSSADLMAELFTDLRKGTGATVISSAGGAEFAMESNEWKNGLFTYCLLNGLKNKKADLNRNGEIVLSELQIYLRNEVLKISKGQQQPTSRMENPAMDYRWW
jgi:WD40 repeat protein